MVEIRKPIPVHEAIARVMNRVTKLDTEEIPLSTAYRRVLAEPILARHDVPPFDRAPYDGFAIRSQDSSLAHVHHRISFRVIEQIGAGDVATKHLNPGEAIRVMTGAALPVGADAVVMLEQATEAGDTFTIRKSFEPLENVSLQGEDAKQGEVLIEQGQLIHPGMIALLATFGYANVKVAKLPKVGVVATGSELLEVSEALSPGKIRNSNGPMIGAQLARLGIPSYSYGRTKDDVPSALKLVKKALSETDCVITTGGVSVGDYDHLPAIYEQLGATILFNKVAMRPGSVTTVAVLDGKLLFGLSGNPSACYIGFELFARPALLGMMDSIKPYLSYTKAILQEDFKKANPFTRFIRAIYQFDGAQAVVTSAGFNKSSAVSSIARGNALMVLPSGTRGCKAGSEVDVLLLGSEDGEAEWRI